MSAQGPLVLGLGLRGLGLRVWGQGLTILDKYAPGAILFLLNICKEGGGEQFFNVQMIFSLNQKTFSIQHLQFSYLIKTHLSPELSMIQLIGIIMKIQTTWKKLLDGKS